VRPSLTGSHLHVQPELRWRPPDCRGALERSGAGCAAPMPCVIGRMLARSRRSTDPLMSSLTTTLRTTTRCRCRGAASGRRRGGLASSLSTRAQAQIVNNNLPIRARPRGSALTWARARAACRRLAPRMQTTQLRARPCQTCFSLVRCIVHARGVACLPGHQPRRMRPR